MPGVRLGFLPCGDYFGPCGIESRIPAGPGISGISSNLAVVEEVLRSLYESLRLETCIEYMILAELKHIIHNYVVV